jgi:hypothetical protein
MQRVAHHRRGPNGSQFAHLHGGPDPYGSPVPLQAGNRPGYRMALIPPDPSNVCPAGYADCIGVDDVRSRSFLSGNKAIILENEACYIIPCQTERSKNLSDSESVIKELVGKRLD